LKDRVDVSRGDLAHRDEDEVAKMKARMREGEEFRFDLFMIVEQKIEIDRSRLLQRFVPAAEQVFNAQHPGHHLRRSYTFASKLSNHVQKIVFAFDLDWLSFVDTRKLRYAEARFHESTDG